MLLVVDINSMAFDHDTAHGPLIHSLRFEVDAGQRVALLGPSGAGKTTLLRIIAGLEHRHQGSVLLLGNLIVRPTRRVQIVFQDNRILPWKTVIQNLYFVLNSDCCHALDLIVATLKDVGLYELRDKWPKQLSGGELSRLALARAFLSRPDVLLLDEPFASLDFQTRARLHECLDQLLSKWKCGLVMVSHDVTDAVVACDTIYLLTTRPMRVAKACRVPLAFPRSPSSREVQMAVADVYQEIGRNGPAS
jgi:sulfonate transport system ATP-binding protein